MSKFLHECPEWDFMEISGDDPEFLACSCFSDPEAIKLSEDHQRDLDAHNEQQRIDKWSER